VVRRSRDRYNGLSERCVISAQWKPALHLKSSQRESPISSLVAASCLVFLLLPGAQAQEQFIPHRQDRVPNRPYSPDKAIEAMTVPPGSGRILNARRTGRSTRYPRPRAGRHREFARGSARRVVFHLASSYPYQKLFGVVFDRLSVERMRVADDAG
jgi:hypothetical protein